MALRADIRLTFEAALAGDMSELAENLQQIKGTSRSQPTKCI